MKLEFRKLEASEIDVRINTINEKGLSLLLYKDARCDMNILDETVGIMNWKRKHLRDNANCVVSLWDEDKKEWVEKEDTGTESFSEAAKGLASDSFKRACVNWGIGRELYTAPFIYFKNDDIGNSIIKNAKGKYNTYTKFNVDKIGYDKKGNISELIISNSKTSHVFKMWGKTNSKQEEPPATKEQIKKHISNAKDVKELTSIWNKYSYLRTEEWFGEDVKNKKHSLNGQ